MPFVESLHRLTQKHRLHKYVAKKRAGQGRLVSARYPDSMAPSSSLAESLREPVAPSIGWLRKALALGTVARRRRGALSSEEYAARVRGLSQEAARASSLRRAIWTLWRIEGLTFACAGGSAGFHLRDADLPLEAGPPAACGLSMAAVLEVGFDARELARLLEACADPRFIDFSFESTGLMLAAYEPGLFGRLSSGLGRFGIMRRYRLDPPEPETFLAALPEQWLPYAAHGFGRLLYFKRPSLRRVIESIEERPYLPFTPTLKGAVAAYVLVNGSSLDQILSLADQELEAELGLAIQGGLRNVTKLLAWSLPGCLEGVAAPGSVSAELLASAVREAEELRAGDEGPDLRA